MVLISLLILVIIWSLAASYIVCALIRAVYYLEAPFFCILALLGDDARYVGSVRSASALYFVMTIT